MAQGTKSYGDSSKSLDLRLRLSRALRERFPQHFKEREAQMHLVDVLPGMTEETALEEFLKTHPDALESDTYIFSWICGGDQTDIYARSGEFRTPVLKEEIPELVQELEHGPPVQDKDPEEDRVRRDNLDWIIESVDRPEPLPPQMQGRILKAADIARADMWKPRRKRY